MPTPEKKELSEQERFERSEREAEGAIISYHFMQSHEDYVPTRYNALLLKGWLDKMGLPWDEESLDRAYEATWVVSLTKSMNHPSQNPFQIRPMFLRKRKNTGVGQG